jgi:hypothetical protein
MNKDNYVTFPKNQSAKEAGIDTTREFILVNPEEGIRDKFIKGDIFILECDDSSSCPFFTRKSDDIKLPIYWSELAYANNPQYGEEKIIDLMDYTGRLGDLVGRIVEMPSGNKEIIASIEIRIKNLGVYMPSYLKLLPKAPIKILSREQAEKLIKEKTRENVKIE